MLRARTRLSVASGPSFYSATAELGDALPPKWRRRALVWAVVGSVGAAGGAALVHGGNSYNTYLVFTAGFFTVPGLAFSREVVRRAPAEHRAWWWWWLYGFRCFFLFGVMLAVVSLVELARGAGPSFYRHIWLLQFPGVALYMVVLAFVWGRAIRRTVRHDRTSKEASRLSGAPFLTNRVGSEILIDLLMAVLCVAGGVLIMMGPAAVRLLLPWLGVVKAGCATFGILAGVFWGRAMVRVLVGKSGHRALAVDALDAAMAVVALCAPLLLFFGPALVQQRGKLWLIIPLLAMALILPAIGGAGIMVFARIQRGRRRLLGVLLLTFGISVVQPWVQIVDILHNWTLPAPPFIFCGAVNFAFVMLVPLFETAKPPPGLDRLSPQAQLRTWSGVPVVLALGIAALFATMEHVRGNNRLAVGYTLGVLIVLVFMATARHFLPVRETRGLYSELEETADELYRQSRTDPLTGLQNRRALFDCFEALLARSRRSQEPLCLVMIDLDEFKHYNDAYGHLAGDAILRKVGAALRAQTRSGDVAARFGGEELCLILPATDALGAMALMGKIRSVCVVGKETGEGISFSAGVAQWDGTEGPDGLISRADGALYRAKAKGRDQAVLADDRVGVLLAGAWVDTRGGVWVVGEIQGRRRQDPVRGWPRSARPAASSFYSAGSDQGDALPSSWRRRAVSWAVVGTLAATSASWFVQGRNAYLTFLVFAGGLFVVPAISFTRQMIRRAPAEHQAWWWWWLYGLRSFLVYGMLIAVVSIAEMVRNADATFWHHIWVLQFPGIAVYFLALLAIWGRAIVETVRHDRASKAAAAESGTAFPATRVRSELAIDIALALLCVSGGVAIMMGPVADRFVLAWIPVIEATSAVLGLAAGLFWGVAITRALMAKSGHRAISVDALDVAMAVLALVAPLFLFFGPDLLRQSSKLWLVAPILGLAVFTPGIGGACVMMFARMQRGRRRLLGLLLVLFTVSAVNPWVEMVNIFHNWSLPSPPFVLSICVNMSLLMLVPLFETTESPAGLDRFSPQGQLRTWSGIPVVLVIGITGLVVTMEHVQRTDRLALGYTLGVLVLMVFMASARHLLTVTETRGLYAELEETAEELYHQSRTDPLTGLQNRRALFDSFEPVMARCLRAGEPLCLVMVDLDEFKAYNDEYGHLAGDGILRKVGSALTGETRAQDVAARFGGEELCLLLPATDASGAVKLMEKIRAACIVGKERGEGISFSAGVAEWDGRESPDGMISRADGALYRAKDNGRDQVVLAGEPVGSLGSQA